MISSVGGYVSVPMVGLPVPSVGLYVGKGAVGGAIGAAAVGDSVAVGSPSFSPLGLSVIVGDVVGLGLGARVANISCVGKYVGMAATGELVLSADRLAGDLVGSPSTGVGEIDVATVVGDPESIAPISNSLRIAFIFDGSR